MSGDTASGAEAQIHRVLIQAYRRLPHIVRRFLLRRLTPSYRVGALCVVERADNALLMVRPSYRRRGWGFPGGFLKRAEKPADAAVREVREELGLEVEVNDNPVVVVDPRYRRVDVIFNGRIKGEESAAGDVRPQSPEVLAAGWFLPSDLPVLLPEASQALDELDRAGRPPKKEDAS